MADTKPTSNTANAAPQTTKPAEVASGAAAASTTSNDSAPTKVVDDTAKTDEGAAPDSVKTGAVPGGTSNSNNLNPDAGESGPKAPVVQRDFPRPEDSANAEIEAAMAGDNEITEARIREALQTRPVTDSSLRAAMTAGSRPGDEWPKPFRLVRGKHDGYSYPNGDRISGEANDGQIFALSKKGFEAFGDKFVSVDRNDPAFDDDDNDELDD